MQSKSKDPSTKPRRQETGVSCTPRLSNLPDRDRVSTATQSFGWPTGHRALPARDRANATQAWQEALRRAGRMAGC